MRDTSGATIRFNQIFSNGGLGIDHADPTGASDAPFLFNIVSNSTTTKISGAKNTSFAGQATDTIDVYANSVCDPSGAGEGARSWEVSPQPPARAPATSPVR